MNDIAKVIIPATFVLGSLAGFSWIFGGERVACEWSNQRINPVSFHEYIDGSRKINGDHWYVDALTTVCYPGYLTGVKIHNLRAD